MSCSCLQRRGGLSSLPQWPREHGGTGCRGVLTYTSRGHHSQLRSELQWALCLVNSSECWRVRELSPGWGPHPMGAFSPWIHLNSDLFLHVPPNLPPREMGHERRQQDLLCSKCCFPGSFPLGAQVFPIWLLLDVMWKYSFPGKYFFQETVALFNWLYFWNQEMKKGQPFCFGHLKEMGLCSRWWRENKWLLFWFCSCPAES